MADTKPPVQPTTPAATTDTLVVVTDANTTTGVIADKVAEATKMVPAALVPAKLSPIEAAKASMDEAGDRPAIKIGDSVRLLPAFGRIQNPNTGDWFVEVSRKVTVDAWIMLQYYAEPPRLNISED